MFRTAAWMAIGCMLYTLGVLAWVTFYALVVLLLQKIF